MAQRGGRTDGRTYVRTDGRTDGRTYGKSPHSTGLRPLSGPLPKKEPVAHRYPLFSDYLAQLIFIMKSCRIGRNSLDSLYVPPSICPSIHPSVRLPGLASWIPGWLDLMIGWLDLSPCWMALRPDWLALTLVWLPLRPCLLALRLGFLAQMPGWS